MHIVMTGGGTGGHIYPALSIAQSLEEHLPTVKIQYVGTARGLEAQLVPREGYDFHCIRAAGLERRLSWKGVAALMETALGFFQARRLLQRIRPCLVIGTGGYVCGPVVLAAARLGIPTMIHEQNAFPGLTNRLLARVADKVCVTFTESITHFPPGAHTVHTGLPIRREILTTSREVGFKELNLKSSDFHILVVGGSRGAQSLNRSLAHVYGQLGKMKGLHWIHVTGKNGYNECKRELAEAGIDLGKNGNITLVPYLHAMENALAVSDLVIGRAGASFLAEILARGIPSILVPYPLASENHQEYNARAVAGQGAAIMVLEKDLTGEILVKLVTELLKDRERLRAMSASALGMGRPDAVEGLAHLAMDMLGL
ncbi:MAG TPA: undecaprenyldiphospho-muramoylpentapeptide beta-N-acetylglucosaminyltransferase [Clostridia bacterium]|nr:undecaprenyldiphospho-muramoylpentapeptide beta-N-acetylglucosaminyltransferase [Clostridia bacterium]